MATWRYKISPRVEKISHSFAALTREIFSTLEAKFRISVQPCNILYKNKLKVESMFEIYLLLNLPQPLAVFHFYFLLVSMKLQSFLFSLLVLSMFYSQCLSASSCKMANWLGTFDHQGWSTCDSSTEYIKGLWRNHNYGDHEISLLEEAKCCSAPTPEENTPSICQDTDWSSVLDG